MNVLQISIIAVLIMVLGMGCSGSHSRHHWGESQQWKDHISTRLELTQEQKKPLEALAKALVSTEKDMKDLRTKQRSQLIGLLGQENLNQPELNIMVQTAQLEFEDMSRHIITKLIEFHKTLNIDQKEKLSQFMNEYSTRRAWH